MGVIKQAYGGTISKYMAPGEMMGGSTHGVGWGRMNYHPGQKAGDQTDYGEYNVLALEYFAQRKGKTSPVDLAEFIPHWQKKAGVQLLGSLEVHPDQADPPAGAARRAAQPARGDVERDGR